MRASGERGVRRMARIFQGVALILLSVAASRARASDDAGLPPLPPVALPEAQPSASTQTPEPAKRPALWETPHYDQGFVLLSTTDAAALPFRLRINHVSQFKYTNTMHVDKTFTTHLGEEKTVHRRNDIQLTRDVFYFSGFVFDRRLEFNILLYTSSATLSATAAGYVGWAFHKAFALRAGYFSLPSTRAMTGTYPFFQGTDRSMALNYMRPGFTQGAWADGEPLPNFHYIAMVGNSLNTLDLAATRIDSQFAYGISLWYDHNQFDKPWNDYESHDRPAVRAGGAFTYAREDRLSDLSTASPENNATFISDGNLLFATGALATDVTVSLVDFYMSAVDFGIKYRGLAFNVEFYGRWLRRFRADGPVPWRSMFDWGFEASLGYFVIPRRLDLYARTSLIDGSFATPVEGGGGFNFYPVKTRQVWLNLEVMGIHRSPYGGVLYVYSAGQTGLIIQSQLLLRF